MKPRPVDLDRHAVLEASAGTGKTYQLERLVLRLLLEKQVRLEQILLVTYTEKATGELRGRLRAAIEKALIEFPDRHDVLRAALDHFDQASIFTIHGFCQRILQEHAFDHSQEFRAQLVQDWQLLPICLREIQRKQWRQEFGDQLRDTLELSGFDRDTADKWEKDVVEAADRFRPACGHVLLPEFDLFKPSKRGQLEEKVRAAWAKGGKLAQVHPGQNIRQHPWAQPYADFRDAEIQKKRQSQVLLPLLDWLANADPSGDPVLNLQKLLKQCGRLLEFAEIGFLSLIKKLGKNAHKKLAFWPRLAELVEVMDVVREAVDWPTSQKRLAVRTVHELMKVLADYKRQRGQMSFEDMLTRMDEGLDPKHNPAADQLVAALRDRYRYAIVDEFQDTDPLQWHIFSRLFLGTETHRLFLVGDPKQAIFSFRGADLRTYLDAVKKMKEEHEAADYPLDVNWRSTPDLLAALNCLFGKGGWFGELLPYRPVEPADEREILLPSDTTGRSALSLVDLGEVKKLTDARKTFARFCAPEIKRLLAHPSEIVIKGKRRAMDYGDFCVLVFKKKEADPLVAALKYENIPYTFYKQGGLWQAGEALQVETVLRALARPEDPTAFRKALLTRFFRATADQLAQGDELPPHHPARDLFQKWQSWVEKKSWSPLFQSLLEETGILRFEFMEQADGERRLANYRQILGTLEQAAYSENLDLFDLLDLLRAKRLRGDEETDLQSIETERPKVKIMTIHAAKGLEFPVVFLGGGYTAGHKNDVLIYRDEQDRVVHDFDPGDFAKGRYRQERDAEARRLLYVALTRAMAKLYVPYFECQGARLPGPLVTILTPALKQSEVAGLGRPQAEIIAAVHSKKTLVPAAAKSPPRLDDPDEVFPRLDPNLRKRRIVIRSFSSLHRKLALRVEDGPKFGEQISRADDDAPDALEIPDPLRGPVFGDMVHNVLEQVDFAAVGRAKDGQALLSEGGPLRTLLDEEMRVNLAKLRSRVSGKELEDLCRRQIADLVWKALHTPLAAAGGPLWQVPPEDRICELEFHFPEQFGEKPPAEIRREEGFLTGFMDLVFRRQGRYFLVDWKTNFLGGYSPEEVAQSMIECDYIRQYRLYLQALARWLRKTKGPAFDAQRDFGGVYYLYMRGLNGKDESTGVYWHPPTAEDFSLEAVLVEA